MNNELNSSHANEHAGVMETIEKTLSPKEKKEKSLPIDISLFNQRLDSQSKRITKLQEKLAQILSNQKHYLKVRLPDVLKREKVRVNFAAELEQARKLLKSLDKKRFTFLSNSKNKEKREQRHIGMFTQIELQRLRRLLDIDHSYDYFLYRKENYDKLKDRHVILLNEQEKRKLFYILRKQTNVVEPLQK